MGNAPTRPPGRPRMDGRPPRGSRVTQPIRARLQAGSALLKSVASSEALAPDVTVGLKELARDIDALLAPRGYTLLREATGSVATSALSLTTTKDFKAALKKAGADFGVRLESVVEDGFRAVLAKRWTPPRPLVKRVRTAHERELKDKARTVLQLQVDAELRSRVEKVAPSLSKELGYRVTVSGIALPWLAEELGVDFPTGDDVDTLKLMVRRTLREHVLKVTDARGVTVEQVLADGVRDMLEGRWEPRLTGWNVIADRPREGGIWVAPAEPVQKAKLWVRLDHDLLEGLRERAEEMNEDAGVPVYPGTLAIQLLKDRLGDPDAE